MLPPFIMGSTCLRKSLVKEAERPMEQTHLKLGAKPGSAKHQSTHRCMKKKYVIMKRGMIMSFRWFVTQYYGSNS